MNNIQKFFASFKQYPELGIALLIVVGVLVFMVWKNVSNQIQGNSSTAASTNQNPPLMVYDFSITPPSGQPVSPPTPTSNGGGTPVTPPPQPPVIPTPPNNPGIVPQPPPVHNPPPKPPATQRTQVVAKWPAWNSTLWGIALHYYGNGNEWPKIYAANKNKIGSDPNRIYAGTVLVIPN